IALLLLLAPCFAQRIDSTVQIGKGRLCFQNSFPALRKLHIFRAAGGKRLFVRIDMGVKISDVGVRTRRSAMPDLVQPWKMLINGLPLAIDNGEQEPYRDSHRAKLPHRTPPALCPGRLGGRSMFCRLRSDSTGVG